MVIVSVDALDVFCDGCEVPATCFRLHEFMCSERPRSEPKLLGHKVQQNFRSSIPAACDIVP